MITIVLEHVCCTEGREFGPHSAPFLDIPHLSTCPINSARCKAGVHVRPADAAATASYSAMAQDGTSFAIRPAMLLSRTGLG